MFEEYFASGRRWEWVLLDVSKAISLMSKFALVPFRLNAVKKLVPVRVLFV